MSANGNKRKPDQNPESSPAPKHVKIDDTTTTTTMSSVPSARPLAQQEINETIMAFPGMPAETKRKYISGIESLRQVVENKGSNSQEGQVAQAKIDKILTHLRSQAQRQQQQQIQMQQAAAAAAAAATMSGGVPSGAVSGVPGVGGVVTPAVPVAGNAMGASASSRWIPPAGLTPQAAEQWKIDIGTKLTGLGQKLAAAKTQVQEQHAALERGGHTPEVEAEIRKKLQDAQTNFTQCKDILGNFYKAQKQLQAQRQQQQLQQQQQQQLQQGQPPQPPQQQQQPHPQQGGMAPTGVVHQQQPPQAQNMQGRPPQQAPQGTPMQQQPLPPTQMPQQQQPQQMPQQQQPQPQGTPVQRVATPVDQTLAGSPANVNSHVTSMNQARQQAAIQQPPAMSPNQSNMQLQNQQLQQGQTPQQQTPRVPQNMVPQQQAQAMGRSPAPANAGTPMTAGPNSPASRPGSTQPQQAGRPQSATGTPVQGQPPQQLATGSTSGIHPHPQGPQQPQQQQRQLPAGQMPPNTQVPVQRDNQPARMPIPGSNFSLPPPVPVSIPAGRPSLTGGANTPANSVLGTPAVIKQPAFEFDEGGMGLLSKRKLEELVKQIDPEEKLDPDVEESILELVDEFIDTIATTACKMAKLRGSDTLDIKDIQTILERNWNIRIPGYSADEIRTVRKFNPAPGYHHKMSALVAQKQLAQTTGKNGE